VGIVFAATTISNALLFVVSLIAARWLAPDSYAVVAAMLAGVIIITVPSFTLQIVVAREVASVPPADRPAVAAAVLRRRGMQATALGVIATTVVCFFANPISDSLNLSTVWPVVFTALAAVPLLLQTVLRGALQGTGRYGLLGLSMICEAVGRLVIAIVALAAGFGATGVTAAPLAGTVVGLAVCIPPLVALAGLSGTVARPQIGQIFWATGAFFSGFAILTSTDLLVVKHAADGTTAGDYAAAAFVGKIVLLLPVAVTTVLVPEVTKRCARGEPTVRLLWQALAITSALCGAVLLACAVVPGLVATLTFGDGYPGAEDLLWQYALATFVLSIAQVYALYTLAAGSNIAAWTCPVLALVQMPLLWAARHDPEMVIWTMTGTGAALLLVAATTSLVRREHQSSRHEPAR
jgi:O-antigen/teichoic acid export membrane protein